MELVMIILGGFFSLLYIYFIELKEKHARELRILNEQIEKRSNVFNA